MAKDYLGKDLAVGDYVAFMMIGYRDFVKGTIVKVNPQKVTIKPDGISTYNRVQYHQQVIKIDSDF